MPATFTPILSTLNMDPGEGLSVFFYDAIYKFTGGGIGDALGYTNYVGDCGYKTHGETTTYNGMQGAYLGIGFDVKGGFGAVINNKPGRHNIAGGGLTDEGYTWPAGTNNAGHTSLSANSITTRLGELSGYGIINTTPNLSTFPTPVNLHQYVAHRDDVVFKSIRIQLQNEGKTLKIQIKDPTTNKYVTYQTIDLDNFDTHLSYSDSIPSKIKVGLCFATSDAVTNCEIKNFAIYGDTVDSELDATKLTSLVYAESGNVQIPRGAGLEA